MARTLTLNAAGVNSANQDLSDPETPPTFYEFNTPANGANQLNIMPAVPVPNASAPDYNIDMDTLWLVYIKNLDDSIDITVTVYDADDVQITQRIPPGRVFLATPNTETVGVTLQADSGTPLAKVICVGA
jgi:hypothetical protein